jgi:hypothetical protein
LLDHVSSRTGEGERFFPQLPGLEEGREFSALGSSLIFSMSTKGCGEVQFFISETISQVRFVDLGIKIINKLENRKNFPKKHILQRKRTQL